MVYVGRADLQRWATPLNCSPHVCGAVGPSVTLSRPSPSAANCSPVFSLTDIPDELCSSETGLPFTNCLVCDRELGTGVEYMVEKAVRKYSDYGVQDTVFEYAVCMDCYTTLSATFSIESRERIEEYFRERVDQDDRVRRLSVLPADDLAPRIGVCMVSGESIDALEEYQVVAHCVGDKLVVGPAPFMIGGPTIDEITGLLSNETLDELGGFRDQYFGLPPEFQPQVVLL